MFSSVFNRQLIWVTYFDHLVLLDVVLEEAHLHQEDIWRLAQAHYGRSELIVQEVVLDALEQIVLVWVEAEVCSRRESVMYCALAAAVSMYHKTLQLETIRRIRVLQV